MRAALTPARWPWWVRVLAVYLAARVVTAVILLVVSRWQEANLWTDAAPSYSAWTGRMWDASWYQQIAEGGYPAELPVGTDGAVQQNVWAFYPLFPFLVRAVQQVTGLGWDVVAPTISLLCGAGAMLVIHRLVERAGHRAVARRPGLPLATVALVSVFPSSVVLQVAYTEALALLLVASALYLLWARRYEWAALVIVLLGFTRAVALPLALVVAWHAVVRYQEWRQARPAVSAAAQGDPPEGPQRSGRPGVTSPRGPVQGTVPTGEVPAGAAALAGVRDPISFPWRDAARIVVLLVVAVLSGLLWQLVCGIVTGRSDAYFLTQGAWRGTGPVVPFMPWLDVSHALFGGAGPWVLAAVLAGVAALGLSPVARRLGPELQAWPLAYLGYLVAVIEPWTSIVRFLLLAFPLGAVTLGWTRSRWWFWGCLAAGVAGQAWWVWALWRLTPPSGWPP
ncbi:hypothetical protein [Oerskovia sp. KBS0722]|uniref:hypothetical protein n=1 Tax=Oerskovia sp. KBS0722 TaxID=1179673 RepID=UPI00110DD878|nr:hypothetical protein [Oerskovia sp. KBS0722]QDW63927.1 hypothetical protein FFI11_016680 [Oerskovia sp. KBS0722]